MGAVIINTFSALLRKQAKAMSEVGRTSSNKKINIQWKANNSRRFNAQIGVDDNGNEVRWADYKSSTVRTAKGTFKKRSSSYYTKNGAKRSRAKDIRYTGKRSELLRDNGRLRQSIAARGNKADIDSVTPRFIELGSMVPYAAAQHKMRRIVGISKMDRQAFKRIYLRALGLL